MAQPQEFNPMQMVDPFGYWKTLRDATLDYWSKVMIDVSQSPQFTRASGALLDQGLGMAQPVQDSVQKAMTFTLAYLNMPTREEVMTLAERLVNIETRLDDLDAKTSDMREDYSAVGSEVRKVDRSLDKVLNTLLTRLEGLEARVVATREPSGEGEPKAEDKPEPKTPPKKQ